MENSKVAVVTGASRGLGAEFCRMLSTEGYTVAMAARSLTELQKISAALSLPEKCSLHQVDLSKEEGVSSLAREVIERHGKVDLLINNAGIGSFKRLEQFETTEFDDMFQLNVKAPWLLTKLLLPQLKQSSALIVMVSSDVSTRTFVNGGIYTATKFALRALTRTFQQENPDLRFLELRPGAIDTNFAGSTQGAEGKSEFLKVEAVVAALRSVLQLTPDARVEEIVVRSVHQAVEY
ncbi:MAG: SDR family oxidoreductase [Candidatus Obscuribacterales bacterium]|nr:SDR family oxidoreductase [Candidatus Obscuribacterales bacterium]